MVLGYSEVGEKLQRVACHDEVVDKNVVIERLVKFLNCLKFILYSVVY